MKHASMFTLVAVMFVAAAAALAQNPPAQKPGPELEKIKYFVGTWKTTGDLKPGPMGPGGKFTDTTHAEWMPGGFFIQMHSNGEMAGMGKMTSSAFMGYNTEDKVYTYDEFSSTGERVSARGTLEGDTWTWTNEEKMMGKTMKGRFTEKMTSPTSYDFKFEMSMEGSPFETVMEGKATKVGGAAAAKPAAGAKTPAKPAAEKPPKK